MREIKKVEWNYLSMQELKAITKEVYGIEYDIQMGEKSNGSYEVHTPGEPDSVQGYHTGLKTAPYGSKWENAEWIELTDEEAIDRWVNCVITDKFGRPFETINDKGEYEWYQPEVAVVLGDLVRRGEIPDGEYFISIDW